MTDSPFKVKVMWYDNIKHVEIVSFRTVAEMWNYVNTMDRFHAPGLVIPLGALLNRPSGEA